MGIDAEMFVRTKQNVTPEFLRAATHKLHSIFGSDIDTYVDDLLEVVSKWKQDGPDIRPRKGETFVRVRLWTRYYGPGYERGNFRLIHDLAEVLETIFPESEVWYGGDSSGVLAEPFHAVARRKMRDHWLKHANAYYRQMGSMMGSGGRGADAPQCRKCQVPMSQYGFGGAYAAFSCECGERSVTRNGVTTVTTKKDRQQRFYELRNEAMDLLKAKDKDRGEELHDLLADF
jgi:hypothetical protein